MRKLLIATLACGFVFAAQAQSTVQEAVQDKAQAAVVVQEDQDAKAEVADAETTAVVNDRTCLRHTGSRLIGKERNRPCANAAGRAYTREDIERTGHVDLLSALRTLDPSIR